MAWVKLAGRFNKLPLVLAGPILRKVTPTSVTVWLALKESTGVTLDVHFGDVTVGRVLLSGFRQTVHVGKNLHIVAITARPVEGKNLEPGEVYFYNLSFVTGSKGPIGLSEATGGELTWGYGTNRFPSFALPPKELADCRIIQGSCRKPNADGPDALSLLDGLIEASVNNANGRPHQLLLSGDQIYADEVADVLLLMLIDAASVLLGPETLPRRAGVGEPNIAADFFEPTTRLNFIPSIGFTTEDTRSHLMSLGEYLAMYLFVWSNVLWPDPIPDFSDVVQSIVEHNDTAKWLNPAAKLRDEIDTQRSNVMLMRASLPSVRRALANIPTYMLLDDHEITDDWNMTQEFCEDVYGNPTGTRIIQNGLVAYALCQHWGNAPEQFENAAAAGTTLLKMFNSSASYEAMASNPDVMKIVGVHAADQLRKQTPFSVFHDVGNRQNLAEGWIDSASLLYHYTIEAPAYQIIVTDTRTWRSFPRGGNQTPPDLIAESQLAVQIGNTPPLKKDGVNRLLMVVVSTNMPPGPAIRQGARDLPPMGKEYRYEDFFDGWEIERLDFARALTQISLKFDPNQKGVREGQVVLLSGDVHASSASRIHYVANQQVGDPKGKPRPADLVLAQLIGSALHNQGGKTLGQHKEGYEYVPPKFLAKVLKQDVLLQEGFVGWNPNVVKDFETVGFIFFHCKVFEHKDAAWGFRSGTPTHTLRDEELPHVWEKHINRIILPPHYRIRLDYLKALQGGRYNIEPVVTPPSPDPMKKWESRSRSYERYARARYSGREIVGKNNIGELEFRISDLLVEPRLTVLYTVRWEESQKEFVRFEVSLDLNDNNFPTIFHKSEQP